MRRGPRPSSICQPIVAYENDGVPLPCFVRERLRCGHPGDIIYVTTLALPTGQRRCAACEYRMEKKGVTP